MPLHTVCRVEEVPIGMMKAFTAGGQKIVLYHLEDGFHATQASCTHMFAPLARGRIIDGCKVQCPLHRARFDIRSGEVVDWASFPPGIQLLNTLRASKALRTYKVSVSDGSVRVNVPKA
ncbi:MAG TPA: Rieske 2Fe-2S domain-containing protein [Steroidobacteraceae bacterium]|nr:Rieske 2Fe-2S domain-containing protein [Steroidobacteraceae bacterium]